MRSDGFSRFCLLAIVALLGLIATRLLLEPKNVQASQPSEYVVVETYSALPGTQALLDEYRSRGYELVAAPTFAQNNQVGQRLFFKK